MKGIKGEKMFFAKSGLYKPCGIYNFKHLTIALVTFIGILIAVKNTKVKKQEDVKKIIKTATIVVWCLEIMKVIFLYSTGQGKPNKVIPLYYCSLLLYSGLMSSFGKGIVKRMGDIFLATGGIVGGMVFIICPTTSLPEYPLFHFISLHSFFFHGTMIYLGLIINKFKYVDVKFEDLKYYACLIFTVCIAAYVVNRVFDSNLMFISKDFPGNPISILYNNTGWLFTPIMIMLQMTLPFLFVYGMLCLNRICRKDKVKVAM